jgi:hypothetical protein
MWNELWRRHTGAAVGIAGGIFLGFIYLFNGLWDMLVFALIVFAGYYFGRKTDRQEKWMSLSDIYHWLTDRWRRFR